MSLQYSTACQSQASHDSGLLLSEIGFQFLSTPSEGKSECFAAGKSQKICSRGHWRSAEDAKLKQLVSQFGPHNWNLIAEKLDGRSGKSCRLRWFNQLDPRINRIAFSEEDEERLLAAHTLYGNKWALIARLFPGRTDNAVKNHWHVVMARRHKEQSCVYSKKRKLSSSQPLCNTMKVPTYSNNASKESTITSNRNESVSTCTDPSLNSPSALAHACLVTSNNSPQQHQQFNQLQNSEENMVNSRCEKSEGSAGTVMYHKIGSNVMVMGLSPFSKASATDSMGINVNGVTGDGSEKISVPFIDFLGVGAT